jgi:hypothetical protein
MQNARTAHGNPKAGNSSPAPGNFSEARESDPKQTDPEQVREMKVRLAELEKLVSTLLNKKKTVKRR